MAIRNDLSGAVPARPPSSAGAKLSASRAEAGDSSARATTEATRRIMRANRSRDTKPEMSLRRMLHAAGLRYRVGTRPLPGFRRTADIVFRSEKVAVFVDGCFWHGCREHKRMPKSNTEFWKAKIGSNVQRDIETNRVLREAGWIVIRIWEHDDLSKAAREVGAAVRSRRPSSA